MNIRWSRAIWWILFALILYASLVCLMTACAKPAVFTNGDRADVIEVHERDMVPEEQEP